MTAAKAKRPPKVAALSDEPANGTSNGPTAVDPMRGLTLLPKIAIMGSARYQALASQPIVYTWEGIAMQGIVVGMTGAPGEGKTTLMFLLAVARGEKTGVCTDVLGHTVTPAPDNHWIVIVEAEHSETSAARKLLNSAQALGLDPSCLDRVITIARQNVLLGSPEWKEIERMIAAGIVSDVFVDSLSRFAPADSNDETEQSHIFATVANAIESARGTQPTFWIVMHSRKGGTTGNTEDISGSQQRGAQLDTAIKCTANREDGRVVSSSVTFPKLREDPEEHPGKRTFSVARDDAGVWVYSDIEDSEDGESGLDAEERILTYLRANPGTAPTTVRDKLGMNSKTFKATLKALKDGKSIRFEPGTRDGSWKLYIRPGARPGGVDPGARPGGVPEGETIN